MTAPATDLCALILAAGEGSRLGRGPKGFLTLGGRTLIERVVGLMKPFAAEIALVVRAGDRDAAAALLGDSGISVVAGGTRRRDSLANLLAASRAPLILLAEAARPLTAPADVHAVIVAGRREGAASLFQPIPPRDSLALKTGDMLGAALPREAAIWVQTPQVMRRNWLIEALAVGTDATSTVFSLQAKGFPVRLVAASTANPKITYPGDLDAAEAMLRTSSTGPGPAPRGRR